MYENLYLAGSLSLPVGRESKYINERMGARPAHAWTQMAMGRLHQARAGQGDATRAVRRFRLAAEEASALGMDRAAGQALQLAESIASPQ